MGRNILSIVMTVSFLVLMSHNYIDNTVHEFLGVILLVLILLHNGLNLSWYKTVFKGKQHPRRILMTLANFLLVIVFLIAIISGLLISQSLVPSIALHGMSTLYVDSLHQSSSHICFLLIGIHLGLHLDVLWLRLQYRLKIKHIPKFCAVVGDILAVCIIFYGFYASFVNHIWDMLLMKYSFVFIKRLSITQFSVDYLAILGCYAAIAYYGMRLLKK